MLENMEKYQVDLNGKITIGTRTYENHKGPVLGYRHVQALLLFLCVTIEMMSRTCLSLSIVAMTDKNASSNPDVPVGTLSLIFAPEKTYEWTNSNVILSSFYWGYGVFQIISGQLAKMYGARYPLLIAMGFNSLAIAFIPIAASYGGSTGVMICRIMQGLCQGGLFPSCHAMLGRWAPENERGRLSTFVYSGMNVGTLIALPITGAISKSSWGWPVTFYLFGGCGLAWCVLWISLGRNRPSEHPLISNEEKKYIETSLKQGDNEEEISTPWIAIFTSSPFWACLVATVGAGFGILFIQNEMPTYLQKAMKYDLSSSGYLTSLSSGVGVICGYIYGPLADFIVEKKYVTQTVARKIFEIYACFGSAATMLTLAYLNADHAYLSVFILCLSSVFCSAILFGHGVNAIDLSPRFAGIVLACVNSTSCFVGLTAPLSVQFIVSDESNASEWRLVFVIAAIMYVVPAIVFAMFGSGERQWWDDGDEHMPEDMLAYQREYERKVGNTN